MLKKRKQKFYGQFIRNFYLIQISKDLYFSLEDNCESMGAKYKNKFCGIMGINLSHHICNGGGLLLQTTYFMLKSPWLDKKFTR